MSRKTKNLTGTKFGRLLVVSQLLPFEKRTKWECKCDCGNNVIVDASKLLNGLS